MSRRWLVRSMALVAALLPVLLAGCGGEDAVATEMSVRLPAFTGPLFHLLLLASVLFVAYLVNQKGEANEDSLFKLGNRLRNLEDRIEELQKVVQDRPAGAPTAVAPSVPAATASASSAATAAAPTSAPASGKPARKKGGKSGSGSGEDDAR